MKSNITCTNHNFNQYEQKSLCGKFISRERKRRKKEKRDSPSWVPVVVQGDGENRHGLAITIGAFVHRGHRAFAVRVLKLTLERNCARETMQVPGDK